MDETFTTTAIVLQRQSFRERDSKVTLYSLNKGRLDLVARGTKKLNSKLAGHIEPFNLAKLMVVRGKQFDYIGSAVSEDCFGEIKSDWEKVRIVGKAIGDFNRLIKPGQADENLFILLKNFLTVLNKREAIKTDLDLFLHFFILKLLAQLGYQPELYQCVVGKEKIEPGNNKFNVKKGGLVCRNCAKTSQYLTISDDCIKILRLALGEDLNKLVNLKISNHLIKETTKIINSFFKYQL